MADDLNKETNSDTNTPPKPVLGQEVLTLANDVTNATLGFTLQSRDEILARRGVGRGLEIYQDLKRDPHVKGVLRKRSLAVVARQASVTAASDRPEDIAAAELVTAAIDGFSFNRFTAGMMDGVLNGYAVGEIVWEANEINGRSWIMPAKIPVRNPRRFTFDRQLKLRLLTPAHRVDGIELPDRKFIVLRYGEEETEDPFGLGLGNALFWPVFFKRKGIAFWFKFVERFGQPTQLGKHPINASPQEKRTLLEAMAALSSESGVAVPEGMMIEFLEAAKGGSINTHKDLCAYMDGQISEAVLGETLSTNIGSSGSRAASETHNEVRQELTDADCELVSDTLKETLCKWIIEINMPGAGIPRIERDYAEEEDLNTRAERDKNITEMGFEPDEEYINATYGGPKGKWTKKAAPGSGPLSFLSSGKNGLTFAEAVRDVIDDLSDQAQAKASPAQDAIINRFRGLLDDCKSLPEFSERLLKLEPEISVADLAAVMGEAMALGVLQGHDDAAGV